MSSVQLDTKHRYIRLDEEAVPTAPPVSSNKAVVYLSNVTGDLSIIKDTGAIIDLEDHNTLTNYVANEHVDHTSVLIQGNTNSGINIDSGTSAVDLTAGTKQIQLNANNLIEETVIDGANDFVPIWDASASAMRKVKPDNLPGGGGGGGGETNTASNVGVGGVGPFKQKTGVDLEFRNINATSSKISVALDAGNDEIDIDVNEANLTLDNIGGTLSVNKGGTGATSHTLNAILKGNGTSSILSSGILIDGSDNMTGLNYLQFDDITAPSNPSAGQGRLYKKTGDDGLFWKPDASGPEVDLTADNDTTDHTLLSNIGTNTHAQIDTHIANGNIHVDHTAVLIQGNTNSGLNIDSGTSAVDLTAGTKQVTLNVNNLATAAAIDPNNDSIAIYDNSATSTVKATIQDILDAASVGTVEGFYAESDGESSMASITPVQKVNLNFTSEAADYIVYYSAEISVDDNNRSVIVLCEEDNTTTIGTIDFKANSGSPGWATFSGFEKRTLTAGSHDYDIDYSSSQNGKTVRIRRARIFVYKVST